MVHLRYQNNLTPVYTSTRRIGARFGGGHGFQPALKFGHLAWRRLQPAASTIVSTFFSWLPLCCSCGAGNLACSRLSAGSEVWPFGVAQTSVCRVDNRVDALFLAAALLLLRGKLSAC